MQASDPSYGIQANLLPHLHLISSFRYPIQANLSPETALECLLQAPRIVKEMTPMSWTYLNPPNDGQLFLTWQPPRMKAFASDGYVWADPEAQFVQEIRGYTLEICVHRVGYAPGRDQHVGVAAHMRTRYHIANKVPTIPGPGFEPSLWIVHYGPNDPGNRFPIDRIPIQPQVRQMMTERQYIEQQGGLQRKEFMLHDRANWPQLSIGQRMNMPQVGPPPGPGYPVNPMQQMAQRPHPQFYPQAPVQQPPAKRQRVGPSQAVTAAVAAGVPHDSIIEDEETTALGDYLDNLTPAEISKMRYKQHHEWMEEIYSSVFSISQIVPEELGLGLTGALKELTDGIFNTPDPKEVLKPLDPDRDEKERGDAAKMPTRSRLQQNAPGSVTYQKLSPEKLDEFEKRVSQYMEKGRAEIDAMKKEHANTVADFKKSRAYMMAERKLRDAPNHEPNGADDVVRELENTLDVIINEQKLVVCVEKGGLEEEDKSRVTNGNAAASTNGSASNFNGNGLVNFGGEDNSAAGLLDQFGSGSYANTPVGRVPTPQISQPQSGAPTPGTTAGPSQDFMQQGSNLQISESAPDDSGLDLIEGMDLDVDMSGLQDHSDGDKPAGEEDWVMVGDQQAQDRSPPQPSASGQTPDAQAQQQQAQSGNPISGQQHQHHQSTHPSSTSPDTSTQSNIPPHDPASHTHTTTTTHTHTHTDDDDIFNGTDFGTFDNLDTAGDALADFDTTGAGDDDLGLDLGGDAFGDAFGDAGSVGGTPGGGHGLLGEGSGVGDGGP